MYVPLYSTKLHMRDLGSERRPQMQFIREANIVSCQSCFLIGLSACDVHDVQG